MSRRRAGLDAPASNTIRTGRSARAGRVVTGMVAGRGGAVGATIARRAGGARARPYALRRRSIFPTGYRGALLGLCTEVLNRQKARWPNISGGTQVCTAFSKSVLRFGKSVLRFMKFFCRSSKT